MSVASFSPTAQISMTASAIEHTRKQLSSNPSSYGLRLAVKKSGCSGWKYDVSLATSANEDDTSINIADGVKVLIDPNSLPLVKGTEIDFVQHGLNSIFEFRNPNAADECGCGESFSIIDK